MYKLSKATGLILLSFLLSFSVFALGGRSIGPEHRRLLPPGHIRAMILDDPAHKMVIGWNNYTSFDKQSTIYYDLVDHGFDLNSYKHSKKADASWLYQGMSNQFAILENLKADTKYYFVILNGDGLSKKYYFSTLPTDPNQRISVIAGGDSRNNRGVRRSANLLVKKLKPHFVMFGGDMTNLGLPHQWINWMDDWQVSIGDDGRVTPLAVARGNHERSSSVIELLFYTKKDAYYSFRVGTDLLHVITLNSEISAAGNQLDWLNQTLENNTDAIWKFAQYHKPMRPHTASKKDQALTYKHWAPLFFQYGVNLVMESDAHVVKTTWPVRPDENGDQGFVRDDYMGTVFAGEGCWGAPIRAANDAKEWTRDIGSFNQFKWIWVDRDKVEMRTVKVDNANEVEEIEETKRFTTPKNINLWETENGSVLTINPRNSFASLIKKQKMIAKKDK